MDWRIGELTLPSEIWNLIMKRLETIDILRCSWSRFGERLLSMPNITKIDIGNISDFDEFEKLTILQKLQDLLLGGPATRPILYNVLEKITSLQTLDMTYFPKNFEAIANSCTQITRLILRTARNDIIDEITAIQKLTKLRKLKLTIARNIPKVDLVGLTHLTNLTSLALTGTNFNINLSRGDFNALTNLKILKLRQMVGRIGPGIQKLTKLEQFQTLQISNLESSSIFEDCLPLVNLTSLNLDSLTVNGKFERMTDLTNLKSLHIDIAPSITDHLPKMTALKKLILVGPVPEGFLPPLLQRMVQLEYFQVWTWKNETVKDEELQCLSNLNHLTALLLYSLDCITSASLHQSISKLTNLKNLEVSGKLLEANEMSSVIDMPSLGLVKINGAVEK